MTSKQQTQSGSVVKSDDRAEPLRVLMVVRLANGFLSSIANGVWKPSGTPAIAKMIERLDGGPEQLCLIMTRALAAGDRSSVSALRAAEKPVSGLQTPVRILAEGPSNYSGPGFWLREFFHLMAIARQGLRFRPDLIYVDRSNVLTGACLARFARVPVVLRLMGVPPELRKILSGSQLARRIFRWAYRSPFAHVISTIEGSRAVDFMSAALDPDVPRSVMLNGVDSPVAEGEAPALLDAIPKKSIIVTLLGRVEALKGADVFVDALLALPREARAPIHGLVVGDGELADELKAQVAAANLADRVTFTGPLTRNEVAHALKRSDIFVSLNRQGHLSNTTLEAISWGIPIVIQEIAETTGPDEFQSLVPRQAYRAISSSAGSIELADTMSELATSAERRAVMSRSLLAFAKQDLRSWDERIEREIALLQRAAKGEGS